MDLTQSIAYMQLDNYINIVVPRKMYGTRVFLRQSIPAIGMYQILRFSV